MKPAFVLYLVVAVIVGLTSVCWAAPSDEVKVEELKVVELERLRSYVRYSIKAVVLNEGAKGKVFMRVVAKNTEGFQVASLHLSAVFEAGETKPLTETWLIKKEIAPTISTWEVDEVTKHIPRTE